MRMVTKIATPLLLIAAVVCGCDRTESDWKQAKQEATTTAYQRYLADHPNSVHESEAQATFKKLQFADLIARLGLQVTDDNDGGMFVSNLFPPKTEYLKFGHPMIIHITDVVDDNFQTTGMVPVLMGFGGDGGFQFHGVTMAIGETWVFDRAGIKFNGSNWVLESNVAGASLSFEDNGVRLKGMTISALEAH